MARACSTSANKPIKSIGDLKGMKVRGPTRQITKLLASWARRRSACRCRGIPDAHEQGRDRRRGDPVGSGAVGEGQRTRQVSTRSSTRTCRRSTPRRSCMAMNKAKYESLPPDLKKVIDANSGIETSGWLGKVQQANDAKGRKTVAGRSNRSTRFTPSDYDAVQAGLRARSTSHGPRRWTARDSRAGSCSTAPRR